MNKKLIGFFIPIVGIAIALIAVLVYINRKTSPKIQRSVLLGGTDEVKSKHRKETSSLNERQKNILKLFRKRNVLFPSDIYAVAPNTSTRTLRRDMDKLVNLDLVIQEGSTKDTRYILKTNL